MQRNNLILISSLEISGDEYAGWLIEQYKTIDPNTSFIGLGGDQSIKAGMHLTAHFKNHATMNFLDIIKKIKIFRQLLNTLIDALDKHQPKAVVLIDSSSFNLRLAKAAHMRNIPVLYLIPPKVWAWASWRLKKIDRYCHQLGCLYSFETDFYNSHNISAISIQHPRNHLYSPSRSYVKGLIAICPGSRVSEIKDNLPQMLDACKLILKQVPNAKFGLVIASKRLKQLIKTICEQNHPLNIEFIENDQKKYLAKVDVAIATSGTLTYELMLLKTPMVVVYRTSHKFNYYIIKEWLYKPMWVSLPNLIAMRTVVPELLQNKVTANNITKEVLKILNTQSCRLDMVSQLNVLRQQSMSDDHKSLGKILYEFVT